jgi:hypothetical protein
VVCWRGKSIAGTETRALDLQQRQPSSAKKAQNTGGLMAKGLVRVGKTLASAV